MSEEQKERNGLVRLGALWAHQDRDGKTYLSGNLGDAKLLVFKNKFKKEGEKRPDYRVYVANRPKTDKADPLADRDPLAGNSDDHEGVSGEDGVSDSIPF